MRLAAWAEPPAAAAPAQEAWTWAKPAPLGQAPRGQRTSLVQTQTPSAKRSYFFDDDLPLLLAGLDLLSPFDLLSLLEDESVFFLDSDSFLAPAL